MRNSQRNTRRQSWLTAYRIFAVAALAVIVMMQSVLLARSFAPNNSVQATKVERASVYLQDAGFGNPVYLGVTPASEGEYPTFQATAIGGQTVKLFIRTTPGGGWEIQPATADGGYILDSVKSADDLAYAAQEAVWKWENIPPSIQPRTDGSWGEYESRKYMYEQLKKYSPDKSYWTAPRSGTYGWPRK